MKNTYQTYFETTTLDIPTINQDDNNLFTGVLVNVDEWIKHEEFRLKKKDMDSERTLREENARKTFIFSICWVVFIVFVICVYGFNKYTSFSLSEKEFMFIIGTMTTTILTFYTIVLKFLFGNTKSNNNK